MPYDPELDEANRAAELASQKYAQVQKQTNDPDVIAHARADMEAAGARRGAIMNQRRAAKTALPDINAHADALHPVHR